MKVKDPWHAKMKAVFVPAAHRLTWLSWRRDSTKASREPHEHREDSSFVAKTWLQGNGFRNSLVGESKALAKAVFLNL